MYKKENYVLKISTSEHSLTYQMVLLLVRVYIPVCMPIMRPCAKCLMDFLHLNSTRAELCWSLHLRVFLNLGNNMENSLFIAVYTSSFNYLNRIYS